MLVSKVAIFGSLLSHCTHLEPTCSRQASFHAPWPPRSRTTTPLFRGVMSSLTRCSDYGRVLVWTGAPTGTRHSLWLSPPDASLNLCLPPSHLGAHSSSAFASFQELGFLTSSPQVILFDLHNYPNHAVVSTLFS